jgi:hypothetical protein
MDGENNQLICWILIDLSVDWWISLCWLIDRLIDWWIDWTTTCRMSAYHCPMRNLSCSHLFLVVVQLWRCSSMLSCSQRWYYWLSILWLSEMMWRRWWSVIVLHVWVKRRRSLFFFVVLWHWWRPCWGLIVFTWMPAVGVNVDDVVDSCVVR